jgi:hypothetical protein
MMFVSSAQEEKRNRRRCYGTCQSRFRPSECKTSTVCYRELTRFNALIYRSGCGSTSVVEIVVENRAWAVIGGARAVSVGTG